MMRTLCISAAIAIVTLAIAHPALADTAPECLQWKQSVAEYDQKVDVIIGGEISDVLDGMDRGMRKTDYKSALAEHEALVAGRINAIQAIRPPADLTGFHYRIIDFYQAVLKVDQGVQENGADALVPYLRDCYVTMIALYQELRATLVKHGCAGRETAALEERIIPGLEEQLEYLRGVERLPR